MDKAGFIMEIVEALNCNDDKRVSIAVTFCGSQTNHGSILIPLLLHQLRYRLAMKSDQEFDETEVILIGRAMTSIAHLLSSANCEDKALFYAEGSRLFYVFSKHSNQNLSHHAKHALSMLREN